MEQFKTKIAETVNIPPETQRIIYCGRVLQDSSKLADYGMYVLRISDFHRMFSYKQNFLTL